MNLMDQIISRILGSMLLIMNICRCLTLVKLDVLALLPLPLHNLLLKEVYLLIRKVRIVSLRNRVNLHQLVHLKFKRSINSSGLNQKKPLRNLDLLKLK